MTKKKGVLGTPFFWCRDEDAKVLDEFGGWFDFIFFWFFSWRRIYALAYF